MKDFVRRRPLIAIILTFFTAGLGQLYNGQLKKAVSLYVLGLILIIIVSFSGLFFSFFGMIIIAVILIGYVIFVMIDAFINARRIHTMKPKGYNRWYLYLLIFHPDD